MKILTPQQIKLCDDFTITNLPIPSVSLMEKAASLCAGFIISKLPLPDKTILFCGKGNNGGDGLAIARLLAQQGYNVEVYIIEYANNSSDDFTENINRYKGFIKSVHQLDDLPVSSTNSNLVIDAILGNGLNKQLNGLVKEVVERINLMEGYKLAIDIPTGIFANIPTVESQVAFKANKTLTFQAPKLNFLLKENYPFVGDFEVLDIGWPMEAYKGMETSYHFTTAQDILPHIKKRERFVAKHQFGHALIMAGSYGKMGATILCAKACLRSGAGLTTVCIPSCGYEILQITVPEAMCVTDPEQDRITLIPELKNYSAIAIGPGLGLHSETVTVTMQIVTTIKLPMVIDADAINIIAANKKLLSRLIPDTIITPHSKEFERLTKPVDSDFERLQLAMEFARDYKLIVVLKGAYTAVINSDGTVYFNSTGNASLAKGGTGDTLTGIILAQLAKGLSPLHAAVTGVYLHGLAADICVKEQSAETVMASDIINALGKAFLLPAESIIH